MKKMMGESFDLCVIFRICLFFLLAFVTQFAVGYKIDEISCRDLESVCFADSSIKCKSFDYPNTQTDILWDRDNSLVIPPNIILLSSVCNDEKDYDLLVPFISHCDDEKMDVCYASSNQNSLVGRNVITGGNRMKKVSNSCKDNVIHRLVSEDDFAVKVGEVEVEKVVFTADENRYCGNVDIDDDSIVPFFTLIFNLRGKKVKHNVLDLMKFLFQLKESIREQYDSTASYISEQILVTLQYNVDGIIPCYLGLFYSLLSGSNATIDTKIELVNNYTNFSHILNSFSFNDVEDECLNAHEKLNNYEEAVEYYGDGVEIVALSDLKFGFKEYSEEYLALNSPVKWNEVTISEYYVILLTFFEDILLDNYEESAHFLRSIIRKDDEDDDDALNPQHQFEEAFYQRRIEFLTSGSATIEEKKYIVENLIKIYHFKFDEKYSIALYAFKYSVNYKDNNTNNNNQDNNYVEEEYHMVEIAVIDELVDIMSSNGLSGTFLNYGNITDGCLNGVQIGCIGELEIANKIVCERVGFDDDIFDYIATCFHSMQFFVEFCNIEVEESAPKFDITNKTHYENLMQIDITLLRKLTRKIYRSKLYDMRYIAANYVHRVVGLITDERVDVNMNINEDLIDFAAYQGKNYSDEDITDELHNSLLDAHLEDMLPLILPPIGSEELNVIGRILGVHSEDDEGYCDEVCADVIYELKTGEYLLSSTNRSFRKDMIEFVKKSGGKLNIPPELGMLRYLYRFKNEHNYLTTTRRNLFYFASNAGKFFLWRTILNPGCEECKIICAPFCKENFLFLNSMWNDGEEINDILCSDDTSAKILEGVFWIDEFGKPKLPWSCDKNVLGKRIFDIFNYDDYISLSSLDRDSLLHLVNTLILALLSKEEQYNEFILRLFAQYMIDYPIFPNKNSEREKELYRLLLTQIAWNKDFDNLLLNLDKWNLTEDEMRGLVALFPSIIEDYIKKSDENFQEYKAVFDFDYNTAIEFSLEYKQKHFFERIIHSKILPLELLKKIFDSHTLKENEAGMMLIMLNDNELKKAHLKAFVNVANRELLFDTILSCMDYTVNECLNGRNSCFTNDFLVSTDFLHRFEMFDGLENILEETVKYLETKEIQRSGINHLLWHIKHSDADLDTVRLFAHILIDDLSDDYDISGFKQYFRFSSPGLRELLQRLKLRDKNLISALMYWRFRLANGKGNFREGGYQRDENKFLDKKVCKSLLKYRDPITVYNVYRNITFDNMIERLDDIGVTYFHDMDTLISKSSPETLLVVATKYLLLYPEKVDEFKRKYESMYIRSDDNIVVEYDEPKVENISFKGSPYIIKVEDVQPIKYKFCISLNNELIGEPRMRYYLFDSRRDKDEWIQSDSIKFNYEEFEKSNFKLQYDVTLTLKMASIPKVFTMLSLIQDSMNYYKGGISITVGNIRNDGFTLYLEGDAEQNEYKDFSVSYLAVVEPTEHSKGVWWREKQEEISMRYRFEILMFDEIFKEPKNFNSNIKKWLEKYIDENSGIEIDLPYTSRDDNRLFINGRIRANIVDEKEVNAKMIAMRNIWKKFFYEDVRCPKEWTKNIKLPTHFVLSNDEFTTIVSEKSDDFDVICNEIIDTIDSLAVEKNILSIGPFISYNIPDINAMHQITKSFTKIEGPIFYTPIKLTVDADFLFFPTVDFSNIDENESENDTQDIIFKERKKVEKNAEKKKNEDKKSKENMPVTHNKSSSNVKLTSNGLSTGQIVGITIGVISAIGVLSFIVFFFWFRKRTNKNISNV